MAEMVTTFSTEDGTGLGRFASPVPDELDEVEAVVCGLLGMVPTCLREHMEGANTEADRVLAQHPELTFVHVATTGGLIDPDDADKVNRSSTGILRRAEDGVLVIKPLSMRGEALPDDTPEVTFN